MILYHGSNIEIPQPKLLKHQRPLDFGPGFYTTSDKQQAEAWAIRTARIRKKGEPIVSIYKLNNSALNTLKVLSFDSANKDWLQFVTANRKRLTQNDGWDIVSGPVANDQTMPTLMLYLDGYITENEAIAKLLPQSLTDQFVFKTDVALNNLHFKKAVFMKSNKKSTETTKQNAMKKLPYFAIDYYDREVITQIMYKYNMNATNAIECFICSETHSILEDAENGMWHFPAYVIFNMWEAEQITGDPRNSQFIRE